MQRMRIAIWTALCALTSVRSQSADQVIAATGITAGHVVVVATTSGSLEKDFAAKGTFVVTSLAGTATEGTALRTLLGKDDKLGDVTVIDLVQSGVLPFADMSVNLFVGGSGAFSDEEVKRVLAPTGKAYMGGSVVAGAAHPGMDSWTHFAKDATGNDVSQDSKAGPVSTVQWNSGSNRSTHAGLRLSDGIAVTLENNASAYSSPRTGGGEYLVAYDAFSGALLWRRTDLYVPNRYALIAEDGVVYCHPEPGQVPGQSGGRTMIALDIKTGTTIRTYTEGLDVNPQYMKEYSNGGVARYFHAVVGEGVLVQVCDSVTYALDAATGARLWKSAYVEEHYYPAIYQGKLIVTEGPVAVGTAYMPLWRVAKMKSIAAYDLRTGIEQWRWRCPNDSGMVVYNLAAGNGYVSTVGILGSDPRLNSRVPMWIAAISATDGSQILFRQYQERDHGGHFTVKAMVDETRFWATEVGGKGYSIGNPGDSVQISKRYNGCAQTRMTTNYILNGFTAMDKSRIATQDHWSSRVSRNSCDVGVFPGYNMMYTNSNTCGCSAMLGSTGAYANQSYGGPWTGNRTESGTAVAAAFASGSQWPVSDEWPMFMRDPKRTNWTDAPTPVRMGMLWAVKVEGSDRSAGLMGDERRAQIQQSAPVSAPVVAEGVAVVAIPDRHQVVAYDPATGVEKWRKTADGRIDSPPTIFQGMVLFGTRSGWVYALNRDSGELIWRFLAAPQQRFIVDHAQAESVWPVSGSVVPHDRLIWAAAGRAAAVDGGLYWYGLNPLNGAIVKQGQVSQGGYEFTGRINGGDLKGDNTTGTNGPMVTDGTNMYLTMVGFNPTTGATLNMYRDFYRWNPRDECVQPGLLSFAYNGGYRLGLNGHYTMYGWTRAKIVAYKGDDFVSAAGNSKPASGRWGGETGLRRFKCVPAAEAQTASGASAIVWEAANPGGVSSIGDDNTRSMIVAGDKVYLGLANPNQVVVVDYATATTLYTLALGAAPVFNGMACYKGTILMTLENGSLVSLASVTGVVPKAETPRVFDMSVTKRSSGLILRIISSQAYEAELHSVDGRRVFSAARESSDVFSISRGRLASGTYILSVKQANGTLKRNAYRVAW